jgi:hypothetical protein
MRDFEISPYRRNSSSRPRNVLGHGEARQNQLLLEHHRDAFVESIARRRDPYWRSVDENAPGIRLVNTVQNLKDCRFAGAILADQADNLAFPDGEADLVKRLHPWEGY